MMMPEFTLNLSTRYAAAGNVMFESTATKLQAALSHAQQGWNVQSKNMYHTQGTLSAVCSGVSTRC